MKKTIIKIAFAAAVVTVSSCAKQLEVAPPNAICDEQIIEIMNGTDESKKQLVFNNLVKQSPKYFNLWGAPMPGTVLDPMTYCYQGIEQSLSLQGNDMVLGSNGGSVEESAGASYYNGTEKFTADDSEANNAHWLGYAYGINQANLILTYMTKEAAEKSPIAATGRVCGLCVRAYSYMCLVEEYCQPLNDAGADGAGLPLYSKYSPSQAAVAPSTLGKTWEFILADLNEAVELAGSSYTTGYTELEDFDAGLANFLFARASLLAGNYADAVAACDRIIESGKYSFIANENYGCNPAGAKIDNDSKFYPQNNAFTALKKNPETIFGYIKKSSYNPSTSSSCAAVQTMLQNPFGYYSSTGSTVRIDNCLYEKIADNDVRKNAFCPNGFQYHFQSQPAQETTTIPSFAAMKYGSNFGINDDGDNCTTEKDVNIQEFCKFRLSEVYLMKAEAQALGSGDAIGTLNALLKARSINKDNPLTCNNYPSMNGMTALQMVQLQYRIEMWGENGREYFNNKRWHINVDRSSSSIHWEKGLSTKWEDMTSDIPIVEKQNNHYYQN